MSLVPTYQLVSTPCHRLGILESCQVGTKAVGTGSVNAITLLFLPSDASLN